jgi:C4-dicarboxylate transporter, DctM subunit
MIGIELGIAGVVALVVFISLGVPLAFGIALIAIAGISTIMGVPQAALQLFQSTYITTSDFVLTSIPLFILMGQLVAVGNLGRDLYDCVQKWMGWLPGGLAVTTVSSCAVLGAVTGISVAGIGTLGPVALPEMRRHGYDNRLAAGALASASTLAILIPPSVSFIVYGIWTETSIGRLFIAGVVPGLIMTLVFCAYIVGVSIIDPKRAPRGPAHSWAERFASLGPVLPILIVIVTMIAGLYLGWFTPSEGAAVGCSAVALILLLMRRLTWDGFVQSAIVTARISIMIFAILIAAQLFGRFLVLTDLQRALVELAIGPHLNKYVILLFITVLYIFLGMIMDGFSMMLLTLPFVFPVIKQLGFDPVWFGVYLTIMVEIGLLTPPVGLNCYMLHRIAPEISLGEVFRGVAPFVFLSLACVALFTVFPELVLWLANRAFG